MLSLSPVVGSALSIVLILAGIVLVFVLATVLGKRLMKLAIGLVLNTVLGFVVLFAMGYFFGITIQYSFAEVIAVILFGLPAVGTFLLLKVVGGVVLAVVL